MKRPEWLLRRIKKRKYALQQERQYVLYFLFWPVFGLRYYLLENCHAAKFYHVVHSPADDWIPFLEYFVIPYFLWHGCIVGMHLWLYFREKSVFLQYSRYLITAMSISTVIFLLYPTCQNLRPEIFPRKNIWTELVDVLYRMDTNTNVCPSEHVIGSVGFFLAGWHCEKLKKKIWTIAITAFLTAIATVFLKQHSVIDVAAAIPVCTAAYFASFGRSHLHKGEIVCWIREHILSSKFGTGN